MGSVSACLDLLNSAHWLVHELDGATCCSAFRRTALAAYKVTTFDAGFIVFRRAIAEWAFEVCDIVRERLHGEVRVFACTSNGWRLIESSDHVLYHGDEGWILAGIRRHRNRLDHYRGLLGLDAFLVHNFQLVPTRHAVLCAWLTASVEVVHARHFAALQARHEDAKVSHVIADVAGHGLHRFWHRWSTS